MKTTAKDPFAHASPRPWTYHKREEGYTHFPADWIQDAKGDTVTENIGHLDGPLICAAVNAREGLAKASFALSTIITNQRELLGLLDDAEGALERAVEGPRRSAASEVLISEADAREDRLYADITAKYSGGSLAQTAGERLVHHWEESEGEITRGSNAYLALCIDELMARQVRDLARVVFAWCSVQQQEGVTREDMLRDIEQLKETVKGRAAL